MLTLPIFPYTNTLHGQSWIKLQYLTKHEYPSILLSCKEEVNYCEKATKQTNKKIENKRKKTNKQREKQLQKTALFPARIELATFRVLGGRDNHYTTETAVNQLLFWLKLKRKTIMRGKNKYDRCVTVYPLHWLLPPKYRQWEANPWIPSAKRNVC